MVAGKKSEVEWIRPEAGGRRSGAPTGSVYQAPAKFLAHSDDWASNAWDLVVEKIETKQGKWVARVQFHVPEAPHDWLEPEARFELYEEKRRVASGRVLS